MSLGPHKNSRKNSRKNPRKALKSCQAMQADYYALYERSVQNPEADIDFIRKIFKSKNKRFPLALREDFCGTALMCAEWIRGAGKISERQQRTALGVDLDNKTVAWGQCHNIDPLQEHAKQVSLVVEDVRTDFTVSHGKTDVVCAFNFSYCIFHDRYAFVDYAKTVHKGLAKEGLFVLDAHGGTELTIETEEETDHGDFTYHWDQAIFNPIGNRTIRYIHFSFPDGSKKERAYIYDWRMWSLPELKDILLEAGFSAVDIYWEGATEEGEGDGIFRRRKKATQEESWIAYVVAWK